MADSLTYASVAGLAMRATRLDACGRPITGGTTDKVVSDGFVSITLSAVVEAGTERRLKNAAGGICVDDPGPPQFLGHDVAINFCKVDPELYELFAGFRLITDYKGDSVGYAIDRDLRSTGGAGLEVWTRVPTDPDSVCAVGAAGLFVYSLIPWIVNVVPGDLTIEDGTATFTLTGRSKVGHGWGRGPYNVVATNSGLTPGRLDGTGVANTEPFYQRLTDIAPPTVAAGYT